jgi:hypothetical protein
MVLSAKGAGSMTIGESFFNWLDNFEATTYKQFVARHEYETYRSKTTVVLLILKSGFEIVGTAGCEDPSKFDEQLGHKFALKDAIRKLGEFAAFYRAQKAMETPVLASKSHFTPEQVEEFRRLWRKEYDQTVFRQIGQPMIMPTAPTSVDPGFLKPLEAAVQTAIDGINNMKF